MTNLPDVVSVGLAEHLVQMPGTFRLIQNTGSAMVANSSDSSMRFQRKSARQRLEDRNLN